MKYGVFSFKWKNAQHKWARRHDPDLGTNKIKRWTKKVQEALWTYVADVWEHRNNIVHGNTKETATQRKLEAVRQQVPETLDSPPLLGARDRHLLELIEVDNLTGRYLHHWRRAVCAAEAQENIWRRSEEQHKILEYVQEI